MEDMYVNFSFIIIKDGVEGDIGYGVLSTD